jgi:MerR family transcriptional regulator, thiopeptide resistance regulator
MARMKKVRTYQVKDVARISGVSVRALHHYGEIGLLVPVARSAAGYRVYDDDSLFRLQQIIINRELGYSLKEIRRLLDDPSFDAEQSLVAQREQLSRRARATAEMIKAVDRALEILNAQHTDESIDMKAIFDGFDPKAYESEAQERWGHTDAYKESARRTQSYTAEDWKRLKEEQDGIYRAVAAAMEEGQRADDEGVMSLAEQHRLSIDQWFYACTHDMHGALADMYEADARFAQNIDKYAEGLTSFLASAIRANARRNGR